MSKITLILVLPVFVVACNSDSSHSINVQNLKILYSQKKKLESVIHQKGWKSPASSYKIRLPFSDTELFRHVWMKGDLNISNDPAKYRGITMDKYFCTDRVYINNVYIGSSTIKRPIDIILSAAYIIPKGLLKKGKNEIHIRLGLWRNTPGGIDTSSMAIGTTKDYEDKVFWNDILFKQLIFGFLLLNGVLLLFALVKYIFSQEKLYLFFLLGTLLNCLMYIEQHINYESIGLIHLTSFPFSQVPLMFIFFILIMEHMYRMYMYNRIVIPLLSLIFILILFLRMLPGIGELIQVLLVLSTILFGSFFYIYLLYKLNSIRPNRSILYFNSIFMTILLILLILEIFAVALGFDFFDSLHLYTNPFMIFALFAYEAMEIKRRKVKLNQLYSTLKEQKTYKKKIPTITDASEEKLDRIIEFINENYTSDISREGLAAAEDINPNYLSSLFIAYTGKKMQEYINSLRVKDAIDQLMQTNKKVIDIAYDSGFESLGTFNRAFKQDTGTSPMKYRKQSVNL